MTQTNQMNYAAANIFGPYIVKTRVIPGVKCLDRKEEKKKEKELFESVDDYIEQA